MRELFKAKFRLGVSCVIPVSDVVRVDELVKTPRIHDLSGTATIVDTENSINIFFRYLMQASTLQQNLKTCLKRKNLIFQLTDDLCRIISQSLETTIS
jgi:hypothetical protein